MRFPLWKRDAEAGPAYFIRASRSDDMGAVDLLLSRSYPRLLKADYPPSVLVTAIPLISRAQPELLRSGTYYVAEAADGGIWGAGGWSLAPPGGTAQRGVAGHIRHFATDPVHVRKGVAAAVMHRVLLDARAAGLTALECFSTRTAVAFYAAQGFEVEAGVELRLGNAVVFPAVRMSRAI
ncbi:GNAT family N-acetyltransferase [Algicella marina]|uniref:GNAT family N-acetyltransferase n=1 Tax=Algicella marina TaxID=2683284 RepID=A0A6P1SWG0_9RHOB|nr:GNAT family N-acetyltransferase [Algicella marina]QHQ33990.1 GNAT family N-acetyltransferase [Algicella marina]